MNLYESVKAIASKGNKKISQVERDCGLANGTIGKWKTASPHITTLKKVADYFGVTVDELLKE